MIAPFGATARDKVTGFTGIVVGHARYISGCSQLLIVPPVGADGSYREGQWLDDQRLEAVTAIPAVKLDNSASSGPDKPAPKR